MKSQFTMLFYTANFTSPAFLPLNIFHCNQDCLEIFTSKKWGQKCPPNAKLLARGFVFFATIGFFALLFARAYFTVDCKKHQRWRSCFLCGITMSKQRWLHFLHCITGEQAKTTKIWTSQDASTYCKGMMTAQHSNIICRIARSNNIDHFYLSHHKDVSNWPLQFAKIIALVWHNTSQHSNQTKYRWSQEVMTMISIF